MLLWLPWLLGNAIRDTIATQVYSYWSTTHQGLSVQTQTGLITGFINSTTPNVRQFLNIPYAVPPVDERRWLPPLPLSVNTARKIDATRFPPSCPQYPSKSPTVYTRNVPEFVAIRSVDDQHQKTSEDCLSLAIWSPTGAGQESKLPVIMFITGGAFVTGGIDVAYQLPHHWVQRTQSHIVVTINYRLNIFGFPNARGLTEQNLGILDQRLALEWVRDNIQAFGGDASRITLWGQSAGGASVDYHNFAFPNDPVAAGLFMDSGSAFLGLLFSSDSAQTNFSFVAAQLGCGGLSARAEVGCMRNVNFQTIESFIGEYTDNRSLTNQALQPILFIPIADEKVIFENYTERYEIGALSHAPAIFTTGSNEGVSLIAYPTNPLAMAPNQTLADQRTLADFTCPAARSIHLRTGQERVTYRWQFAGNFSNVSPLWWMGAYHSADLPLLFGSHQDYRGQSTSFEFATSYAMQDYALAFMKDPVKGPASVGWQPTTSGIVPRFGAKEQVVDKVSQQSLDQLCTI